MEKIATQYDARTIHLQTSVFENYVIYNKC